jgi:hypothetical protein
MLFVDASTSRIGIGESNPGDTLQINGGNIVNPNSTGSEITSATVGVGGNIHLEERQPDGAFSDRTDLVIVTNTGFGVGESDKLRLAASGAITTYPVANADTVFNESGVDADFRVESDTNANMLFVDASTNRVGVGTGLPTAPLEVNAITGGLGGYTALKIKYGTSSVQSLSMGQVTAGNGAFIGTAQYRSGGNWQTEGTAAGVIDFGAGGNFVFSTNSGLTANTDYIPTSRFSINITEAVFNDPGEDYDFRVESDSNANMLFVDASTNRVGVGMSTPLEPLHATGRILSTTTYGGSTQRIGTSIGQNGNTRADIDFRRWTGASTNHGVGMIEVADTGIMRFYADSATSNTPATTERMSLAPSGAFTTTPTTAGHAVFNENGVDADFRVESNDNENMLFVNGGTSQVVIGGSTSGTYDTLTVNHFGASANNNAGITIDANASSGTGQAALRLLAGSGSTNRAARVDFLNGVVSTTVPQWTILNDYLQDGTNDFNIISGGSDRRLVLTSGSAVFNEIGSDVDFRVESDNNTHALFVQGSDGFVGIGVSAPSSQLNVVGSNVTTSTSTLGQIHVGTSNTQAADVGGSLSLGGQAVTGSATQWVFGTIEGRKTNSSNGDISGYLSFKTALAGTGLVERMTIANTGAVDVVGAFSKGSGSFKISHPLPSKTETHNLVHSFIEGPQADNIYRGKVTLVDGSATVNIDSVSGMSEGTYVLLNTNTQCFTSNESGWTAVKGSVSGNILTITAQESCTDTISWMVVGERHDQHMLDTEWTDENGKVIVEPLKKLES